MRDSEQATGDQGTVAHQGKIKQLVLISHH
jgi:hypothetical protein